VRVARWILGIAVAVVLLALAALLIAMLVINPDRYRGEIESVVHRETGRPLVLLGHLRLTWYPWLGVRSGPGRLESARGAGGPDLLDWQSAAVRVRLLPLLLHRRLQIGRIRLVGAAIHLRRGPHGRGNWDDLTARLHPAAAPPGSAAAGPRAAAATLGGLDLVNGSLDYVDARSRAHVSLTDWQLSVGAWRAGRPLSLRTSFLLHAAIAGGPGRAAGSGKLRWPPGGVRVSLDAPRLQLGAKALELTASRWSLGLADAKAHGTLDASRDASGRLTASGALTAAVPSLRRLARTLGTRMPALQDPGAPGALSLSGKWRYRGGALEVEPLTVRLDSTTITGWLARAPLESAVAGANAAAGEWTFALRADQVDFGRYLTRSQRPKPPQLPVSALRALHARGTLEIERARIGATTLKDVRLQVQ
jgi:AsmA protein